MTKKKTMENNFHLYLGGSFIESYATLCQAIDAANELPWVEEGYTVYDLIAETKWVGPRPGRPPGE